MNVKRLAIKISIEDKEFDYFPNNSPFKINNIDFTESQGEVVNNFGNLQISYIFFKTNFDLNQKEFNVKIKGKWVDFFVGKGLKQEINLEWVTLKLFKNSINTEVDLLEEISCEDCDDEVYFQPVVFGKVKKVKLPLLKKANQEFLLPKNGFAEKSYSGADFVYSTILNNKIILWLNPNKDVYFDILNGEPPYLDNFDCVEINTRKLNNYFEVRTNFEEDCNLKVQIFRKTNLTVWEHASDFIQENSTKQIEVPPYSANLKSLKDYEFKIVIFNKEYLTINNYLVTSSVTITTNEKDRLENIERNIDNLHRNLSSESTSRINNDLSLSKKIDDTSDDLTEKIELTEEQINEKIDNMLSLNGSVLTVNTHDVILNTLYATNIKSDEATIDKIKNNELRTSLIIIDNKNLNKDYFTNLDELTSYFVKSDNITVKNNLPILFSSRLTSEYLSATTKITTGQVDTKNINLDNFNIDKPFIQNLQRNDLDFEDRIKNLETQINALKSNSDINNRINKLSNDLAKLRESVAILNGE
jgi:hypothetical protein